MGENAMEGRPRRPLLQNALRGVALALLAACLLHRPAPAAETPERAVRDVTFVVTSDSHYKCADKKEHNEKDHETVLQMNAITAAAWPEKLGGGAVSKPRGVLALGDVIDDGDRLMEGKNMGAEQWKNFLADFGLDGTDGVLKYPVFEGWGNHDGPPVNAVKNGFSMQAELIKRNAVRKEKGWLTNLSENGLHYSWDWDDVHFVQLNLYPADRQREGVKYSAVWHNPQGSLSFLKQDLARLVGTSGRPVVLVSHCGFDTDWWVADDWKELYEAAKPYNVILYLYGHTGTGLRDWAPPGESRMLRCVNTGQTNVGFFVVQIRDKQVRLAYRTRARAQPNPAETAWDWTWPQQFEIRAPEKRAEADGR
jgi:cytolysin (calcineurin-like family phosphatase)